MSPPPSEHRDHHASGPRIVPADKLASTLSMVDAIDALDRGMRSDLPQTPPRHHLDTGSGDLLLMPSWGGGGVGVKLVTVNPSNSERGLPLIQGLYALFEPETLSPVAVLDGAALTAIRTAAVTGVATRHLAPASARHLVVFGAGPQARSHVAAMAAVLDLERVTIVSRSRGPADRLVEAAVEMGLDAAVGVAGAVAEADVVCTCTSSSRPVFDGRLLRPGTHVNAIGTYRPGARELDDATIAAGPIVVDTSAAATESGDVVVPLDSGVIDRSNVVAELAELCRGMKIRSSEDDITIFKSVGAAFQDLLVAIEVLRRFESTDGEG